ncbi:MAG: SCP2 sterol-binding domain-containing protein [Candidatus Sericytochromatia bacterium]
MNITKDAIIGFNQEGKKIISAKFLREICLEIGADDVGFINIDNPEISNYKKELTNLFPKVKGIISFVCRMNKEPVRSAHRSIANNEFHHVSHETIKIGHEIAKKMESLGIKSMNEPVGFPMEAENFPDKMWMISFKPLAEATGLGKMGIHRNIIHPKFGNFILLGAVLIDIEIDKEDSPINYNPCFECKLCVAACPVGAISPQGEFNFSSCYTHNYREFMGGFNDWVENIAESKNRFDYRKKVSDSESISMWQSLAFGSNYKAAYCMSVCPAGENIINEYMENKKAFIEDIVKPLQKKEETLYVVKGSDAESYALKKFPNKKIKNIHNGLFAKSIKSLISSMPIVFQKTPSLGLDAIYNFTFTGNENVKINITIKDQKITIKEGLKEQSDLNIVADSKTWLKFLRKEKNLFWAIATGKIKFRGNIKLLQDFGKCFPN